MANQILSIDVHDELLQAVIVEQKSGEVLVHACAHVDGEVQDGASLAAGIDKLVSGFDATPSRVVLGLPLSLVSLRNLHLPFAEKKKMAQVLPLELEEQLLAPVDRQIIDFIITGRDQEGSTVLVAAIDREILAESVATLAGQGCAIKKIYLTPQVLCHACMSRNHAGESALFLSGDEQALTLALWNRDQVFFMRKIPWPEPMVSLADTAVRETTARVPGERDGKMLTSVCREIQVSLYYVTRGWQDVQRPEKTVLTGRLADAARLPELIGKELEVAVSVWQPGHDIPGLALDTQVQQQWNPVLIGPAIELALAARQRGGKQRLLNLLKGEFAPGPEQYLSGKTLRVAGLGLGLATAALIAFLWFGYQRLDSRAAALLAEMNDIYHQVFPGGPEKVERPYLFMQSKMREMEGTEVALPLFSGKKRILDILTDISTRIPEDLSLHVSRLVVDAESVQLKGITDAFNNVDVIKNRLAESHRYGEVKIVSATADKKKGKVRFEIHLQLNEAS